MFELTPQDVLKPTFLEFVARLESVLDLGTVTLDEVESWYEAGPALPYSRSFVAWQVFDIMEAA